MISSVVGTARKADLHIAFARANGRFERWGGEGAGMIAKPSANNNP